MMVARTRLSVIFIRTLPVVFLKYMPFFLSVDTNFYIPFYMCGVLEPSNCIVLTHNLLVLFGDV
jgi:hypothetical protein